MTGRLNSSNPQTGNTGVIGRPQSSSTAIAVVFLVVATIIAYGNSFRGPLVFDDVPSIAENRSIQTFWPPWTPLFPPRHADVTVAGRPIANVTFAINHAIHGTSVVGYHVVNLLIHLAGGLTLFAFLRSVIRRKWPDQQAAAMCIPFCTSLLWLVHPLNTESVTFIVQRVESLAGLFYLLTVYAGWRAMTELSPQRGRVWAIVSVITCTFGMATKETMASAPLMVLLMNVVLVSGSFQAAWRAHRRLHLGLFATWLLLAVLVITSPRSTLLTEARTSPWHYFLTQCDEIVLYLRLCFWPSPLIFDYGEANEGAPLITSLPDMWPQATLLVVLAIAALAALIRRSWLGLAGFVFFAVLAPSSSFVPIHSEVIAEHRMYLPLASVLLVVIAGLWMLASRIPGGESRMAAAMPSTVAISVAIVFIGLTRARNENYRSERILWEDTIAKRPDSVRAHYNLGTALGKLGDSQAEIAHYRAALALSPMYPKAHNNLGKALKQLGDLEGAAKHLDLAIEAQPKYALAHFNLGLVRAHQGRLADAIAELRLAIRFNPEHFESHNNLGNALTSTGAYAEAIAAYRAALEIDRDSAECWYNLGTAQLNAQLFEDAAQSLNRALRLMPDHVDAHYNLGHVLERLGQPDRAIDEFRRVLSLQPNHAGAAAGIQRLTRVAPLG